MPARTRSPRRSTRREPLRILPQPDGTTCGPTCLHAVYRHYGDDIELAQVVAEVSRLEGGGTLAVMLANHALRRGYAARIYTYNLQAFDPTWFTGKVDLRDRLQRQAAVKTSRRLQTSTAAYLRFLERGGEVFFEDLTTRLLVRILQRGTPILTGLSATYLYRSMREFGPNDDDDDVRGTPVGHFVVLSGYDTATRRVRIADPWVPNPAAVHYYRAGVERVIGAILLGVLTYDANLLIVTPRRNGRSS